jgi:hypothetical protein
MTLADKTSPQLLGDPIRKALTFSMNPTAREWSELALKELESGSLGEAERALRNARAICDGPTAARHLRAASDQLKRR